MILSFKYAPLCLGTSAGGEMIEMGAMIDMGVEGSTVGRVVRLGGIRVIGRKKGMGYESNILWDGGGEIYRILYNDGMRSQGIFFILNKRKPFVLSYPYQHA